MTAPDDDARREQLARAAAAPSVQAQLASHDDYLGALKLAGEMWMVACLFVGIYTGFVLDEQPAGSTGAIAGLIVLIPATIAAMAPGMWLSVTINRMRRTPQRRVVTHVTSRDGGRWVRRLQIVTLDAPPTWVVPRFKALVEGTSGAMAVGTVAVAVLHGDKLVDWFPVSDARRATPG
jgi:hypothetical protein